MRLGLHQSASLQQRLQQSPQMIQAMQILQLNGLDLEDRIQQELNENPFLEEVEPGLAAQAAGGETAPDASPAEVANAQEDRKVEAILESLEQYQRDGSDGRPRARNDEEGDKKLEAMNNTADQGKSLAEALIEELAILRLEPRDRRLAEYVLYSLDERGWLTQPHEDVARDATVAIAAEDGLVIAEEPHAPAVEPHADPLATPAGNGAHAAPAPPTPHAEFAHAAEVPAGVLQPYHADDVEIVLEEIRRISHPALGARDLKECLQLQLVSMDLEDPLPAQLVEAHLEDIEHNRLPRIAKATNRTIEDVKAAIEVLRTLEPNPGSGYGEPMAEVITPDVIVEEIDGEFQVRLQRERSRELRLSPQYRELLKQAKKGDGVRDWVKKRLESARWFLDAVQLRQSTLHRVAQVIFQRQRAFLEKGTSGFQPLRMQEVADEVGVHISTVSRAVSGKYAQTPRGIFPLKFFFAGGTQKSTGEVASQISIKQRIAEIVSAEDHDHPLSDDEIADKLEELDHVRIARRTVTKYRKALNIPASTERRKF
ncbi:MAG: RNA polymerase factor sigma-54 [Planctomycetes bacterium]|nr:RNA polymerase factor sigma-54 [Planctomycetota bacterium]